MSVDRQDGVRAGNAIRWSIAVQRLSLTCYLSALQALSGASSPDRGRSTSAVHRSGYTVPVSDRGRETGAGPLSAEPNCQRGGSRAFTRQLASLRGWRGLARPFATALVASGGHLNLSRVSFKASPTFNRCVVKSAAPWCCESPLVERRDQQDLSVTDSSESRVSAQPACSCRRQAQRCSYIRSPRRG